MMTDSVALRNGLNECLNADGSVKPVYQGLMDSLETLGASGLQQRWQQANNRASMAPSPFCWTPRNFAPCLRTGFHD